MSPHEHREHNVERLVDALGAVVWEFDWSTDAFIYVSQAAEQLTGFTRDEWMEPGFWASHIHPDDAEQAIAYCRETTGRGEDHQFDYRFLRADGTYVWVRDIVTVDKESTTRCALKGLLLDISAEKAAEAGARQAERRMNDLLDGMGIQAMAFEPDGTISYANQAACKFHGRSRDEIIGHHFAEFTPADQTDALDAHHQANITGAPEDSDGRFELVNAAGERRVLRSSLSVIPSEDGAKPTMFVVAEDVTESIHEADEARRKAAEFDAVFEMLRDLYFRVDRNGVVLDYKAPADVRAYWPREMFVGSNLASTLPEETRAEAVKKLDEAFSSGHMMTQQYSLDVNGAPTQWEARILPLSDTEATIVCRDVTARHRREQALADSEQRYRTLVEIAPYAILVLTEDLRVAYANEAAGRLLETRADALIGQDAPPLRATRDLESPDDIGAFLESLLHSDTSGPRSVGPSEVETITTMRGNSIEIERTAAAIIFEGEPAILLIARDVTAERAAELEVERSRDLLERVLGLIPSGVMLVDDENDFAINLCNQTAERMFGFEPGTMVGTSVIDLHPDQKRARRIAGEIMTLNENETYSAELSMRRRDGSLFDGELSIRMLGETNGGGLLVVRDVSDRKAAEQLLRDSETRLRQIILEAPFGVHLFSLNECGELILVGANPAADEILGVTHDSLIGQPLSVAVPDLVGTGMDEVYRRIARDGGQWECEFRLDSVYFTGTFEVHVFRTEPGQVVVFFEDITNRATAAEMEQRHSRRLSALAAQLEDAQDRERRHLAEELHDRVSQALAVARMRLRLVISESHGRERSDLEQTSDLLDDAIKETRAITTELFPPVLYELGLPAALRWVCEEMERQYGFGCRIEIGELVLPMTDDARAVMFRSARELLLNSMKHSGADEAHVSLTEQGNELVLEIADAGVGFNPAEQIENEDGGGFGLFSIRERVANTGGSFSVDSEYGRGTRASIRMPAGI